MSNITASMVKELRDLSGAGMMDCKSALNENGGDIDAAVDWLRTKGLAKAAKKSGRVAAEGLVGVASQGVTGSVVEVNSETDFVARNDIFQAMVKDISSLAVSTSGAHEDLLGAEYPGAGKSVEDHVTEMVGTIGENMTVRRSAQLSVSEGVVASYVHSQVAEGLGKIGVLVALESSGDTDKLNALGKESGKPDEIIDKMVDGRIRKFYEEVVLESQVFVIDGETRIAKVLEEAAGDVGGAIKLKGFVRFELGQGVDKGEEADFAAEVAAAVSGE